MASLSTSHYKIFEYWRNKVVRSNGEIVTREDIWQEGDEPVVVDYHCPRCWGCGTPVISDSRLEKWILDNCSNDDEELNIQKLWNHSDTKSKLERCHIIPNIFGGADSPENLFLMCAECHQLSPDTIYPDMFFKWVLERMKKYILGNWNPKYILDEVSKLLERDVRMTITELLETINKLGGTVKIEESPLKEFMQGKIGTHRTKMSESSAIIATEKWLISIYNSLIAD